LRQRGSGALPPARASIRESGQNSFLRQPDYIRSLRFLGSGSASTSFSLRSIWRVRVSADRSSSPPMQLQLGAGKDVRKLAELRLHPLNSSQTSLARASIASVRNPICRLLTIMLRFIGRRW